MDETGKLNFLSIIHRPDDLMDGCGLVGKPFPSGFRTSSTPRFPNYRLGPLVGSECDTVTTSVAVPEMGKTYDMTLTPNPSSGPVDVEITLPEYQGHQVGCEVIDGLGRTVSSHTFPHFSYRHSLDASAFAPGLYVVQLIVDGRVVKAEKLVVVGR
ncbi:MAG: T9SS type A sorting domain-containing protein [Saprospiraceae bacterium]|nr:T9SS type A sorting domain-containing protein [Saprospiraceae bacterium]